MNNKNGFIEIPIEIMDRKQLEMLGENHADTDLVRAMFKPEDISFYREDPGTNEDPTERTEITFKNGRDLTAVVSIVEFEKLVWGE
jgi:hypothetical protein